MGSYGKFVATTRREAYPGEYRYVIRVTEAENTETLCRVVVRINSETYAPSSVQIERPRIPSDVSRSLADAEIRHIAEMEVNAIPGLPSVIVIPGAASANGVAA